MYIAEAKAVHTDKKVVEARSDDGITFAVPYDKLVIATGSQVGRLLLCCDVCLLHDVCAGECEA